MKRGLSLMGLWGKLESYEHYRFVSGTERIGRVLNNSRVLHSSSFLSSLLASRHGSSTASARSNEISSIKRNNEFHLLVSSLNLREDKRGGKWDSEGRAYRILGVLFSFGAFYYYVTKHNIVEAAKPFYSPDEPPRDEIQSEKAKDWSSPPPKNDSRKSGLTNGSQGPPNGSRRKHFNFIADVVEKVGNSVVCIEVKDHAVVDWSGEPRTTSNGSGFIITADGLILTNAHVVEGRTRTSISVHLFDGRVVPGRIESVDNTADLATIRISAKGLPTLPLGISSDTRIGEWVVALGSPLSLKNSATVGVISSVGRPSKDIGIGNNINYIQTDAAITFGNSGGPLVNLDGEAIGINSMKVTSGISFAIPIDYVKTFLAKPSGAIGKSRRYMGLTMLTLTEPIIDELRARGGFSTVKQGVLILKTVVGSPAYLSGLQPGDIIIRINGTDINNAGDVYETLKTEKSLKLTIIRGDKKFLCNLTPEDVPS